MKTESKADKTENRIARKTASVSVCKTESITESEAACKAESEAEGITEGITESKSGVANCIRFVCFLLIVAMLGMYFGKVFEFKYGDGIYSLTKFYEEDDNSLDVICFGSSHIFENVNTATLWNEFGIASFDLCGSTQPFWNTYHYMQEALKTQRPKVMVLDIYGALWSGEYTDRSKVIKNNFGLKLSKNKLTSVWNSLPSNLLLDYLFEYPTYHSRYSDISVRDFLVNQGMPLYENWKGFGVNTKVTRLRQPANVETNKVVKLNEKSETYLKKIIELSKERSIPLVLVVTPYFLSKSHKEKYNYIEEVAKENDIPFIDYNLLYQEMGLDFSKDFADEQHLNQNGNVKFTRHLGNYLKGNYKIPDHRGEVKYQSYDKMAQHIQRQIDDAEIRHTQHMEAYLKCINKDDYLIVYTASGAYKGAYNYEAVRGQLSAVGIDLNEGVKDSMWVVDNHEMLYKNNGEADAKWHLEIDDFTHLQVTNKGESTYLPITIYLDKKSFQPKSGLNILVYNKYTKKLVDDACFRIKCGTFSYKKTKI